MQLLMIRHLQHCLSDQIREALHFFTLITFLSENCVLEMSIFVPLYR
jgi:hypothetical protein